MSTIANLKKAYQSQAISKDTHTLEKFVIKNEDKDGNARMEIVGIESKYVPKYDKSHDGGALGYRTRFFLKNGETVGTFSNAAYGFFQFFAGLMGYTDTGSFLHIDINGMLVVNASVLELDQGRSTYNFEILEEGELNGLSDYLPTAANILALGDGRGVDAETGEVTGEPAAEETAESVAEKATKKK